MDHKDLDMRKKFAVSIRWIPLLLMLCGMVWGCGASRVQVAEEPPVLDDGFTVRSISSDELERWAEKDADLTQAVCVEILARLNGKDRLYVKEDIRKGRKLKVPNDFRAYAVWTPLPPRVLRLDRERRCIVVVKDIPFLGWYENGKLVGDSHVCIGKKSDWTRAGLYRVTEKDIDHVSRSYRSAYGYPALMPYAMKIYGRVWIHGGDIVGGYCSHGCINLPMTAAEELFKWTDPGTVVVVVESVKDLDQALEKHSKMLARS